MTPFPNTSRCLPARRALVGWCVIWIGVSSLAGCVTPWERKSLLNDKHANIDNVQGPTERRLREDDCERDQ